ncbi:Anoctamin-1 Discovered on gastrointestinal stromal tumors protein 1 [Triplophysa tibetana]|uniref:Anoctamin n=1 Tax=Triplophysa tibetana TaxID=1572043 RepID=A0A5A9P3B0_9TELE|nr:Anoctamin-1 Discovered on gastrointestinal stromal tumors protein 1 [Triplophysa tibetana]
MKSPSTTENWNGAPERMRVSSVRNETSSMQSDKLRSLARDISELGQQGTADTCHDANDIAEDTEEPGPGPGGGLYFADGQRRVDYVLVKHSKRRNTQHRLSVVSNGNVASQSPTPSRRSTKGDITEAVLEAGLATEPDDGLKDKIREEFERGLQEEGLEIERDKELRTVRFTRLHVPWSVLSREAELLKIRVPTKKTYQLKEKRGIVGVISSFWAKINQPFQPGVAEPPNPRVRVLSQPFSRDKLHLFDINAKSSLFSSAVRGRIVYEILRRTACTQSGQTMGKSLFSRYFRVTSTAQKIKNNVMTDRKYFGEKIGLYFAWLGVYTQLLIPASALGVAVFLYGCFTVDTNVPRSIWLDVDLIYYCVCMYLAAVFLEHWKRKQRCLQHSWNLTGMEDEENELRPAYEDFLLKKQQKKAKKKKKDEPDTGTDDKGREKLLTAKGGQAPVGVTFSAVSGVILYRIIVFAVMSMNPDHEAKANVRVTVTTTAVIINLLVVLVLDEIYGAIAAWITELGGCLIEVCIQLGIIMLGKQLIQNNVFEIAIPKLKKMYRVYKEEKEGAADEEDKDSKREPQRWDLDYELEPYEGLSPEYMEMVIQYGFVTLFVASFPLAPVFALLNNVIEIRLDAAKFVTEIRRPDAVSAKEIGIWYNILSGISKFAVITNAFVISFTSEFIPRMVYQYLYSETGTMHGFTNHTLAYFNTSNFKPGTATHDTDFDRQLRICRYKDYRDPPWSPESYQLSKQYWSVLAARLAFVIFFQNLAMFLSMLVAWLIPDVPRSLKEQLKKENALLLELMLTEEMDKESHSSSTTNIDKVVQSLDEEPPDEPPVCRGVLLSQSDEELKELQKVKEPEEQPSGTPTAPPGDLRDDNSPSCSREALNTTAQSLSEIPCQVESEGFSHSVHSVKTGSLSRYQEFDLNGSPSGDPSSKAKSRCRTLPSRHKVSKEGAARPSHSTTYTHFDQKVPPSPSEFARNPSKTESSGSQMSMPTHLQSHPDSKGVELPSPSKPEHTMTVLPRPSSRPELAGGLLTVLPRPPSKPDLAGIQSTGLPRPPSKPELMGIPMKGLLPRDPGSKPKGRCQTLPPKYRETVGEASARPSHSTTFTHLNEQIPPSPSDLKRNPRV